MKNLSAIAFLGLGLIFWSCSHSEQEAKNDVFVQNIIEKDSLNALSADISPQDSLAPGVSPAALITPGLSIGKISVNQKGNEVNALLGVPDFGDAAMQKSISGWYNKEDHSIQTKIYFENDMSAANTGPHVKQIRINSPFFKTKDKLAVGSNLKDIKLKYPNLDSTQTYTTAAKKKIILMDDKDLGIAFEINEAGICRGITVHERGHDLFGYLQFYE